MLQHLPQLFEVIVRAIKEFNLVIMTSTGGISPVENCRKFCILSYEILGAIGSLRLKRHFLMPQASLSFLPDFGDSIWSEIKAFGGKTTTTAFSVVSS